jgi:hypothetical protein
VRPFPAEEHGVDGVLLRAPESLEAVQRTAQLQFKVVVATSSSGGVAASFIQACFPDVGSECMRIVSRGRLRGCPTVVFPQRQNEGLPRVDDAQDVLDRVLTATGVVGVTGRVALSAEAERPYLLRYHLAGASPAVDLDAIQSRSNIASSPSKAVERESMGGHEDRLDGPFQDSTRGSHEGAEDWGERVSRLGPGDPRPILQADPIRKGTQSWVGFGVVAPIIHRAKHVRLICLATFNLGNVDVCAVLVDGAHGASRYGVSATLHIPAWMRSAHARVAAVQGDACTRIGRAGSEREIRPYRHGFYDGCRLHPDKSFPALKSGKRGRCAKDVVGY